MTDAQPISWLANPPPAPLQPGLTIVVPGIPVPQGSLRAFARNGHAWATSDNPRTRPWKAAVTSAAAELVEQTGFAKLIHQAIAVRVTFRLPRPKGHYGRRGLLPSAPPYPNVLPDLDKLARAILDALTGIVWRDDAQVVRLAVEKVYAEELVTTITVEAIA